MEVNVYNIKGEDTGRKVTLNESIFGIEPNDHAIYLDVKQFMANQRQGTHKSKERSEISGSTRKIGRQKGGGGARRGDMNSPVLVGGARVFGPKPRDYFFKLNKKVKTLARKSALSYKAQNNAIIVVEDFTFEAPKTKEMVKMLENIKAERRFELAFEGVRYYDLLRWHDEDLITINQTGIVTYNRRGQANAETKSITFRKETGGFLPIPQTQIDLSGGVLTQNAGWEGGDIYLN